MKDTYRERQKVIQVLFLLATFLILFKAIHIQLLDTSYRDKARATAIGKNILYPSRGLIYDRNMKILVNNEAMYDLMVTYKQIDPKMDTLWFCNLLGIDIETFKKKLNKDFRSYLYSPRVPFVFMSQISAEKCVPFRESLYEFPGFSLVLRNVRAYPHQNAAHVLGYMSEVTRPQIENSNGKYVLGDYIGITGLEAAYEDQLRGNKGIKLELKDNLGRPVGSYKNGVLDSLAVSGYDLITGLDLELQAYGELLMRAKTGSIVAIEPSSGEVLTMISAPTYDPNLLTINQNRGDAFNALFQDSLNPFFDRSIRAEYPPGSIFKSVVSLAAMQEGLIQANTGHTCTGAYYYNNVPRGCHQHPVPYNLEVALQHSCNTYFFHTIRKIVDANGFYNPAPGLDTFARYCTDFGLGKSLGLDLPNEANGNIPTSEYYDYLYPKVEGSWKSPTVMSIGIGQGEIQMTTLQMANLAAIIANRGYYYPPHLVKAFKDGSVQIPDKFKQKIHVPVNAAYFDAVVNGMEKVVTAGTATVAYIKDIPVCGKTGTSQNPHGKDHSVFFAFAPKENPKIAIAVYVEHGIWGSSYAAPIASLMIEKYLKRTIDPSRKYLEDKMMNADLVSLP